MKPGMHVVQDKTKKVLSSLKGLGDLEVLVGIPADGEDEDTAPHSGSNLRTEPVGGRHRAVSEITNAMLGYIHENGAPEMNIPERAFLVPGIRDRQKNIARYLRTAALAATKGDTLRMMRALHAAGMSGLNGARNKISTGPFTPLKPGTIAARRRRSKGSDYRRKAKTAGDVSPLIDTGQLRNALTYVVRSAKRA